MRDEIVPVEHMVNLEKAAYKAKFIDRVKLYIIYIKYTIADGDHNTNWTRDPEKYFNAIANFINRAILS